ncbi:hypothetical protein D3C73_1504630 [compost metagenome]
MRVLAFNIDFAEHRKRNLIIKLAKALDFLITPWLLSCKLIARKSENDQTLLLVPAVQLLQPLVMRR